MNDNRPDDRRAQRKAQFWALLEPLVRGAGVELFDLDLPGGSTGHLRVYVNRPNKQQVSVDDCAAVARAIRERDEQGDEFLPGDYSLEVSSPGVNRRLSRPEHFSGAVGERVRVTFLSGEPRKRQSATGTLQAFTGMELELAGEAEGETRRIPFADVQAARIDFLFTEV